MSFEAESQDSRDPNSPQWGYLKVKNPKTELQLKKSSFKNDQKSLSSK